MDVNYWASKPKEEHIKESTLEYSAQVKEGMRNCFLYSSKGTLKKIWEKAHFVLTTEAIVYYKNKVLTIMFITS